MYTIKKNFNPSEWRYSWSILDILGDSTGAVFYKEEFCKKVVDLLNKELLDVKHEDEIL